MSQREIASLACKVLGVYMIMQGLDVLGNVAAVQATTPDQFALENPMSVVFPFLFLIAFGIVLWLLSDKLSGIMVKGESPLFGDSRIQASELQRVAFSMIGLWFLGSALPKLVSLLTSLYPTRGLPNFGIRLLIAAGGPLTQFFVGLGIFLGSQGLVNLLNIARHAGLKMEEEPDEKGDNYRRKRKE